MLSFSEFLQEKVLNIGLNPKHKGHREKYRQQIHDVIQKSYAGVKGGYGGQGSGSEAESKAIHADISDNAIKATRRGGAITQATIYKQKHGRKIIATGHNQTPQGKADWHKTAGEDVKHKRAWIEASGAAKAAYKSKGMTQRAAARAPALTGKSDVEVKNRREYTRNIGGERHTKTILGFPKKEK